MADEKPADAATQEIAKLTNDELRIVVDGTKTKLFLKDRFGKEHELLPLTIRDIIDFEAEIGSSILAIMNANLSIRHIVYLLYCSLRKEGLGIDDIRRKKWVYSEQDVQELFDMSFLRSAVPLFTSLLKHSGFGKDKKEGEENPPKPPAETPK